MLSIRGIYDGVTLRLLENVEVNKPQEVIITFINSDIREDALNSEIQQLLAQSHSFDFLKDEAEDIYTDANLKVRY